MEILRAVRQGSFADHVFEGLADGLSEADRRLTQELAYGVLRLRNRLDHSFACFVRGGIERLEPDVLDILRLAAYQLLELDRVPAYAAVSDAVEAAKAAAGKGGAALTNAVLRRLSRDPAGCTFPQLEDDPAGHLSAWGSHPRWLVERWLERWCVEDVGRLVDYNNTRPAVYLTVLGDRRAAQSRLEAAGLSAVPVKWTAASLRIESGGLARALKLVPAVVQDPSAAAVTEYLAAARGCRVFDLCAAPGGKAAVLAGRGHEVVAVDRYRPRIARLLANRERLGLTRLHVVLADSRLPPLSRADIVLLDVPCTGTGTLARHPDARWRLTPGDLNALVELQCHLLDSAAKLIEPGGQLVYSTCSLEPEENEEQVSSFLERWPDFELDQSAGTRLDADLRGGRGVLQVLPQRHRIDGAYAATLRRRPR